MKNLKKQKTDIERQLDEAQKSAQDAKEMLASHRYNSDDCGEYLNMIQDLEYWDNRIADLNEELKKINLAIENKSAPQTSKDIVTCGSKCLLHYNDLDEDLVVLLTEIPIIDNDEKDKYVIATTESPLGKLILNQKVGFSGTYNVSDSHFETNRSFNITIVKIF